MKTKILLLSLALFWIMTPNTSSAYFTTEQSAIKISDRAALFTIKYHFGHQKNDMYLPVFGKRGLAHNSGTPELGYTVLDNGKITDDGEIGSIVLSNASIKDGMYKIPAGSAAEFTFVGIYMAKEGADINDFAVHIQELPFYLGDNKSPQKLNPSELQYYLTPEVNSGKQTTYKTNTATITISSD